MDLLLTGRTLVVATENTQAGEERRIIDHYFLPH